ncbi:efflux RND transporter permease subunit [Beijerinckia indica]|uniref:Efflux pump membrane transporter n=1 Tax=Beijerinckia indica subsp. indica (strain ATCC 9039 / DSM 1715 / NCIMB 8712) TaxID=395963 RepID=B2IHM9_BEII9|nr:multidrug efflux RND transporter permease subunit [Beijerinckia indica]ACB94550.1 transporter, hydrophobe/amphiphile efflux-1 (HAE1) family [Beijerinckia indica subsp. indica ATCC 9039]
MRLSHFFIDRPIFATVLSLFITIIGLGAYFTLPVAEYPEIVPPTVQITATYPGASADVVSRTVATPLEQQINGVENMLYMSSQATGDGKLVITITFKIGTNLDTAQVLTQNRVSIALPRLPQEVQRLGVTVRKTTPDILILVHLFSPDGSRDQLYMSNYATLHVRDVLSRLEGIGDVQVFGSRDYSMRIWLDPDKVAAYGLTAGEVVSALQAQNVQVSAGILNQPPLPSAAAFQLNVQTLGRLTKPEEFAEIIIKSDEQGRLTRVKDVGRVEVGAQDYGANGFLDGRNAVPIPVYQQPGSNALETANRVRATMDELARDFPPGLAYDVVYDPTRFIEQSVHEVLHTIIEAIALVVVVVILFLQTWRASIIPIVAIPISLIGTFAILAALGFSLNNLSLFGLVLAVGIVVDDAIVVVENVERNLQKGLSPREAAHLTMDEVGGALIAIALTLCAVFIPSAFISGISGAFFRQFAVTIAASTIISCLVSLTLSPALCALLLRPHTQEHDHHAKGFGPARLIQGFFNLFNRGFDWLSNTYGRATSRLIRLSAMVLIVYAGLIGLTGWQFSRAPTGFVPEQDQGYLINILQLPPGASLDRTEAVLRQATDLILATPGVAHVVPFSALDATTFTNASNAGTIFAVLDPFEERHAKGQTGVAILAELRQKLAAVQDAFILSIAPPPVQGIGTAGGFKLMVQDRQGLGSAALEAAAQDLVAAANQSPAFAGVFTLFNTRTPSVYADIDRAKAQKVGVTPERVFEALQVYLGSAYINDFNYLGRTYEVIAQADGRFRRDIDDIARLRTRNAQGAMVPIGTVATFKPQTAPYRVPRYNLFPNAEIMGAAAPGVSTGTALATIERLAQEHLPAGFGYEWTEIAYQQKVAGTSTLLIFGASILFVFLVLAAQYESWKLPLSVILIVPMCLLAAVTGLMMRGMAIDILAQIGFVVLVGLAAKNAILIVEFAKQAEDDGATTKDAAVQAARTRLRPILMTSLAFILGVLPLVMASGAGAEMRQSLGTAVFFGMLGVTFFGLIFTPIFYVAARRLSSPFGHGKARQEAVASASAAE